MAWSARSSLELSAPLVLCGVCGEAGVSLSGCSLAGREGQFLPPPTGRGEHRVHTAEVLPLLQRLGSLRKAACTSRGTA